MAVSRQIFIKGFLKRYFDSNTKYSSMESDVFYIFKKCHFLSYNPKHPLKVIFFGGGGGSYI